MPLILEPVFVYSRQWILKALDRFDEDENGTIEFDEFKELMKSKLGEKISKENGMSTQ